MNRPDKLIQELIDTLEGSTDLFNKRLPSLQTKAYKRALELVKELELSNGNIRVSIKNARIVQKIRDELKDAIISKEYKKKVEEFLVTWDKVEEINARYFSTINDTWKTPAVFAQIKKQSLESIREKMLGRGIQVNVVDKAADIVSRNFNAGGSYADFTEELRTFLMNDEKSEGAMAKYAKTFVTDNINQYNREYTKLATDDLGLVFYRFVGPLKDSSRELCIMLIEAKNDGCLPYVHVSQFPEILKGHVCGKKAEINKKTGLPNGLYPETNPTNYVILSNGYECSHTWYPVSNADVSPELRKKFGVD